MKLSLAFLFLFSLFCPLSLRAESQQQTQVKPQEQTPPRVEVIVPKFAQAKLEELGFVAIPQNNQNKLAWLYRSYKHQNWPVIITSDAILHASHLAFGWYQRYLEIAYLRDDLLNLTDGFLHKTMEFADQYEGPLHDAALYNAAYFTVAKALLTDTEPNGIPSPWKDKIQKELDLIKKAQSVENSPIFEYKEDYTQYKPRGHYARSPKFQQYFRAMTWYGRMAFRLQASESDLADRQTRQALLICKALEDLQIKGETALNVWKRIYETTSLFAGRSDDLTVEEYLGLKKQLYTQTQAIDNQQLLRNFQAKAAQLRKPRILSTYESASEQGGPDWTKSTKSMHLFGTRYALDSEIMQRLTYDSVKEYIGPENIEPFTLVKQGSMSFRGLPRGLDILSVFSFPQASALLKASHDDQYTDYQKQTMLLQKQYPPIDNNFWQENLYTLRLKALLTLADKPLQGSPKAMRSESWQLKQLTAALGSWTELRHDTILYTKQPYALVQAAFAGAGKGGPSPPPPPPPHGYVEPVPNLYKTLSESFQLMDNRIKSLGFPEDKALNQSLLKYKNAMDTLEAIAKKQLEGKIPTDEEYRFIENSYCLMQIPQQGLAHHRDVSDEFMSSSDNDMLIAADVFTNLNSRMVLEEAVGYPMQLYMICPVDGKPTVCTGAVYSYHEFKQPITNRLTDQQWSDMLKATGKHPPREAWTESYVVEYKR